MHWATRSGNSGIQSAEDRKRRDPAGRARVVRDAPLWEDLPEKLNKYRLAAVIMQVKIAD
jgi:hypothetical protein